MVQSIKHPAFNWADGMKISERHFFSHDNFIIDSLRDVSSLYLNKFNYGLLPTATSADENSIFAIYKGATNDIQLVIKHCSAITPAGYRIDLSDYTTNIKSLSKTLNSQEENADEDFYVLISVNPFERVPFGDIDPEETPPRQPFTASKHYIDLLSAKNLVNNQSGGNYLVIGKVNLRNNMVQADRNFIPPCTSIYSHYSLLKYYRNFAKYMDDLQQFSFKIIQKTINANQNTVLANNIPSVCSTLVHHVANVYFCFRTLIPGLPPIYLVDLFSRMALHLYNHMQSLRPAELEEMLNYVFEWSEIAPHTLTNRLSNVAEINYDHNQNGAYLMDIQELLMNLEIILGKLSELDYIGQHKENIIVNERDITPAPKAKKGWNILD
ncbi:MAG: hypothetical protein LBE82_01910 [Chitinophagaceae bacterium]|jgi:hypothetical protein|nr:hypothetical protein [Chitinophagaceae bacterium]